VLKVTLFCEVMSAFVFPSTVWQQYRY